MAISISAHAWGEGQDGEGSVVLCGERVAQHQTWQFEWSGGVFSPLPFTVAVWVIPSPGAPCA